MVKTDKANPCHVLMHFCFAEFAPLICAEEVLFCTSFFFDVFLPKPVIYQVLEATCNFHSLVTRKHWPY